MITFLLNALVTYAIYRTYTNDITHVNSVRTKIVFK